MPGRGTRRRTHEAVAATAIVVNPEKHRQVKRDLGQAFADWILSPEGQRTIAGYRIGGEQLFFPNANR